VKKLMLYLKKKNSWLRDRGKGQKKEPVLLRVGKRGYKNSVTYDFGSMK